MCFASLVFRLVLRNFLIIRDSVILRKVRVHRVLIFQSVKPLQHVLHCGFYVRNVILHTHCTNREPLLSNARHCSPSHPSSSNARILSAKATPGLLGQRLYGQ